MKRNENDWQAAYEDLRAEHERDWAALTEKIGKLGDVMERVFKVNGPGWPPHDGRCPGCRCRWCNVYRAFQECEK